MMGFHIESTVFGCVVFVLCLVEFVASLMPEVDRIIQATKNLHCLIATSSEIGVGLDGVRSSNYKLFISN